MNTDVMIDLETLDKVPTTVILSIGIVEFNPEKGAVDVERGLCLYPDIQEQIDAGRTISASTLEWWMKQSDEARKSTFNVRRKSINETCETVRNFFSFMDRPKAWGNGSVFDITIIENFMEYTKVPWKFWDIMDTRTLHRLHPFDKTKQGEIAHTALEDAIAQAERVCEVWPKKK